MLSFHGSFTQKVSGLSNDIGDQEDEEALAIEESSPSTGWWMGFLRLDGEANEGNAVKARLGFQNYGYFIAKSKLQQILPFLLSSSSIEVPMNNGSKLIG